MNNQWDKVTFGVNFLGFGSKCVSNNIEMISWKFQFCIPKCRFSHASTPTIYSFVDDKTVSLLQLFLACNLNSVNSSVIEMSKPSFINFLDWSYGHEFSLKRVFDWRFLITYIFSKTLKFRACYITGQWSKFTVKNATLHLYILS